MASSSNSYQQSSSEDEYDMEPRRAILNVGQIMAFGDDEPRPVAVAEGDDAAGQAAVAGQANARLAELVRLGLPENINLREGREWCRCGNCIEEEMWENRACCQEIDKVVQKNKDEPFHNGCITNHPWFEPAILNPATLQIAYWQYVSQYHEPVVERGMERRYRYTAYRQFVQWCWGYLGKSRRFPMMSCVVKSIREAYPDPGANYTGFRYPRLDR